MDALTAVHEPHQVRVALFVRTALLRELLASTLAHAGLEAIPGEDISVDSGGGSPTVAVAASDGGGSAELRELLAVARRQLPHTPVVVVGPDDRADFLAAMSGGAVEYVTFDASTEALAEKLRAVALGGMGDVSSLREVVSHVDDASVRPHRRSLDRLTERELDVLVLVTRGRTTKEIAAALSISIPTVRSHVHHVLTKLGVHTRVQAAALAADRGLR